MQKNVPQQRRIILALATVFSLLALWGVLGDIIPLTYFGEIGGVPMLLINGLHGGRMPVIDTVGYTVFVAVNIVFYYALFSGAIRLWTKVRGQSRD